MAEDAWDPQRYEQFRRERSQPFFDLLALVRPRPGLRVLDLGCGTGALTRHLHERLQARSTLGIDRSPRMLAEAARHAADGIRFEQADIRDTAGTGPYDLVFSNAALQWLPDHEGLLRRLAEGLAPGGQLAVQVPDMEHAPAHNAAAEVARRPHFAEQLGGFVHHLSTLPLERYAELLDRLGFAEQQVVQRVYGHRLPSREAVIDWMRGTLLTAYQERLPPAAFERFVAEYRDRLFEQVEDRRPFYYPYRRTLFWAALPDTR